MDNSQDWQAVLDKLASVLATMGGDGWLVGGCLRDALLGVAVADVDIALTIPSLPVAERLAPMLPAYVAQLGHGTIRLALRRAALAHLDLTPLQGDSIADDLSRRDFTVNAMALPLASCGEWIEIMSGRDSDEVPMPDILDPFDGRGDATARRLVAVGPTVFRDDPGRIVRAARLQARFGLMPDAGTLHLMREAVPLLKTLSPDRLREEMELLLALPGATDGVELVNDVGALSVLYIGMDGETAAHALLTLRQLDQLMGIGSDGVDYPELRMWSASDARKIALRQAILSYVCLPHDDEASTPHLWREALAVLETVDERELLHYARLLFMDAGQHEDAAADALMIAAACGLTHNDQHSSAKVAERAEALIGTYLHHREELIPLALLRGSDLIVALGLTSGPIVGQLLRAVRLAQLAGEITNQDEALTLARRLHESRAE